MKIIIFSNIPSPYFVEYLNELGKYADVLAIFERRQASDRDSSWKNVDARSFDYSYLRGINIGAEASLSLEIKKLIKSNRDRVIIFANPTTPTGIIGISFCKRKKIKYCLQSEGGLAKNGKGIKEWFKRKVLAGAEIYLSGMKPENDYFIAYGAPKERVFQYNFASFHSSDLPKKRLCKDEKNDLKRKIGIPYERVVLYVGRMLHVKGVDVLLNAFVNFPDDVGLYLVGGEETDEYREIIERKGIRNYRFIHHLPANLLADFYKAADIFVLPTRSDTWGLVINEAMAYSLPIITTNKCVAGLELINDSENGFLVDSEDCAAIRDRIWRLLNNPSFCSEIGEKNFKRIENYTYENMAKQIFGHLMHLLGNEN